MFVLRSIDSPVSTAPNFIDSFAHNCTFLKKLFFKKGHVSEQVTGFVGQLGRKVVGHTLC